ncbi:hypothetical protein DEFDS_0719 [Deferribacter desulfuricans SSM1]|uniref:Uncharacterized protein n=1 Tax=Deferribacter desulfuricans (strain DSM 14783 / JCM 11476 / NBRC 101012 / SSM1) TaxID=639282 RepID=D3PC75_DEFDS|nr:hypothetical protein [Deferribacter desulfuricans]BAI80198.1 hypothetical protein DEFDS_0719 [Deferribacter desulfuricans SSM1]
MKKKKYTLTIDSEYYGEVINFLENVPQPFRGIVIADILNEYIELMEKGIVKSPHKKYLKDIKEDKKEDDLISDKNPKNNNDSLQFDEKTEKEESNLSYDDMMSEFDE